MRCIVVILCALGISWGSLSAHAQEIPDALQGGPESAVKQRKNAWTLGIIGGQSSGSYMRFADELAKVLDDGDEMRVIPMVSYGAASNLEDLLYLRGVDLAITQSDVFEYFRSQRRTPNLDRRINYILRLPISEVHILARKDITKLEDLRGKKVNFGPVGAGSSLTGPIIFQRLNIEVEAIHDNSPDALKKLQAGETAAMIRMVGKPIDFFNKIPADAGLHFLTVPFTQAFDDYYTVGIFTHEDYPTLVPEGGRVETLAVPTVLAVYNWNRKHDRYRRLERFVERLFNNWETFQKPPYHPKWKEVSLDGTVPGWTRFPVAEELLQQFKTETASAQGSLGHIQQAGSSQAQQEALFKLFMEWRAKQKQSQN